MIIDFRQAFIDILKNNKITHLPDQNLIDISSEIALLVWQNYEPLPVYNAASEYDERLPTDWGKILGAFKRNPKFWEQAFELNNTYAQLLNKEFQDDFPYISSLWLSDDSKLILAWQKTKNEKFLDLVNNAANKEEIHKKYLLTDMARNVSGKDLILYQNDKDFVINVLRKLPYLYENLSPENKHQPEYISLAIAFKSNIKEIPLNYQDNSSYRDSWFNLHLPYLETKDIKMLTEDEKFKLFKIRPIFINNFLMTGSQPRYIKYAIDILNDNFPRNMNSFHMATIKKLKPHLLKNEIFINNFKSYLNTYDSVEFKSKIEEKIFLIAKGHGEYEDIINNNLFFIIKEKRLSRQKFSGEEYTFFINTILDKHFLNELSSDNARNLIQLLHPATEIEFLKTLPKTKDLFTYYQHERLSNLLPEGDRKSVKRKI